jgi:hypothetical protein
MWQKLIYSIFVLMSPEFSNSYVFIFKIIFARTSYATTVNILFSVVVVRCPLTIPIILNATLLVKILTWQDVHTNRPF